MKTFRIRVFGWHTEDNPRGPILKEDLIEADDYMDALKVADRIWQNVPGAIAYKVYQI
jgi:hypothetical protein